MNLPIGVYRPDDAREIFRRVLGPAALQPSLDNTRDKTIHNLLYYALLLEDLEPASNSLTGYTQAEIRIIRYVQPSSNASLDMEESTSTAGIIKVTNRLTSFSASAGDLLLVIRHGSEWSPVNTGTGGGGETIWFTIEEVLCPETDYVSETTLVVTATWYTGGCNKTPPGAEYGGDYYVYDICNYLYGLTPTDLVGTTGRATYHYPLIGACEPKWIIDDLCAQPEC
jgi:hypothetical protein